MKERVFVVSVRIVHPFLDFETETGAMYAYAQQKFIDRVVVWVPSFVDERSIDLQSSIEQQYQDYYGPMARITVDEEFFFRGIK